MNKPLFLLLFVFLMMTGVLFAGRLIAGSDSVFAYYGAKRELAKAEEELSRRRAVLASLKHKKDLVRDDQSISRDILETESIRQLNRIPRGYFVITE